MPAQLEDLQTASSVSATTLIRFRLIRAATLSFTSPLSPEDMMVQSCAEASPVKWHLAHTSWFFETFVLTPYLANYQPFHPEFHWLFNSYYNSLGDMPAKNLRASFSRPPLEQIIAYRRHVDAAIEDLLSGTLDANAHEILERITLGLQHEQQHLELIATDIKHAFFTNPLHPALLLPDSPAAPVPAASDKLSFTGFAGGLTQIGTDLDLGDPLSFAFDNETPRHTVYLQPFALADRLITAGEYLGFIDANGYTRPELWLSEGWSASRSSGWQAPLYWRRCPSSPLGWSVFTLKGWKPLDEVLEEPVCHVSYFEADAYARWRGLRLPTEFEWEHACATQNCIAARANMLESGAFAPVPAEPDPGLQQMLGDVWEWTASGYTGYPGYKPLPGALGEYNGKFMSSQVILRGGSCVTPRSHIRATYRNFFSPGTKWQFSGIRLATDAAGTQGG